MGFRHNGLVAVSENGVRAACVETDHGAPRSFKRASMAASS